MVTFVKGYELEELSSARRIRYESIEKSSTSETS